MTNAVINPAVVVHFPRTVVHNAIGPGGYTDLDMSAVTGARHCAVLLSLVNGSGGNNIMIFRRNGEAALGQDWGASGSGVTAANRIVYLVVQTDNAGIVEWLNTNVAGTVTIIVEAFWHE